MGNNIITFGCRLNIHESEVIREQTQGLENVLVFNTCAVTQEAIRQARQAIRKARRTNPNAKIVVTGCAAQIDPSLFSRMQEVDLVLGNHEKNQPETWRTLAFSPLERVRVNDIFSVEETASHFLSGFSEHSRAFVQIQNGCDHRCTFCVIPYGRGASRSVGMGEIVQQIEILVEKGYGEVILTGVDLTSWGKDLPGSPSLGLLVRTLLKCVPSLQRLRLSSLDSIEVDPALLDAIGEEERLMPHFHLSLQSGDDLILKRMKRRHLRQDAIDFCATVRTLRPNVAFGADLIAGFPTETEEHFRKSLDLIDECGLTFLHVFPFSAHPQTPASKMPQVAPSDIKARAQILRKKGAEALQGFMESHCGTHTDVFFEKETFGRTPHAVGVWISGNARIGETRSVHLTSHNGTHFLGNLLK